MRSNSLSHYAFDVDVAQSMAFTVFEKCVYENNGASLFMSRIVSDEKG